MKRIAEYSIESLGEDHPQYFQGAGVAHTRWDQVAVGIGENASEAYEDALEFLAQDDWDVDNMPKHPRGIRKTDRVDHSAHEGYRDDHNEGFYGNNGCDGDCEMQWYVAVYVREPKHNRRPPSYSRDDVERHSENYYGSQYPAVNVKVYDFPTVSQVVDHFKCSDDVAEKALEYAFESAQESFWERIGELAEFYFGKSARVYQTGRSGGWLIVQGIGLPEDWGIQELNRWRKFEAAVKREVKYLSGWQQVSEAIESNEWTKEYAERYNFIDTSSGPKCVADLNQQIAAAADQVKKKFLR